MIALLASLLSLALAVGFAAIWVHFTRGETREMAAFTIWSLPLAVQIAVFARKPRWSSRRPFVRALASAFAGVGAGVLLTVGGGLLLGGWMLAWDFPVFYCWTLGGMGAALTASLLHRQITPRFAVVGAAPPLLILGTLWWYATRPEPAVLITYRGNSGRDAAQFVWDSVLTRPHESGIGRELHWPMSSYSRSGFVDSAETRVLIVLRHAEHRDSVRALLAGHPLVKSVVDTAIER